MSIIFSRFTQKLEIKDYKYEKPYKINIIEKDFDL